ncbi:glycine--tRNA ligase, partial [Candidatus Micrarchaeota archaeon]
MEEVDEVQEELMAVALKRNFLMPANEIYGHTAGFYDYGVVGAAMKRKLENAWRELFLWREGFYEIERASVLPAAVLKASGHVDNFGDMMARCAKCGWADTADAIVEDAEALEKPEQYEAAIKKLEFKCPKCGSKEFRVAWFKLMFETKVGAKGDETGYLRPETAQGIFVDFPRIFRALGSKLPLGVGQIGKSFRNEIAPRQALMRLREFTQMELEYFFDASEGRHPRFGEVEDRKVRVLTVEQQRKKQGRAKEISCMKMVEEKLVPNEAVAYFMYRTQQFHE